MSLEKAFVCLIIKCVLFSFFVFLLQKNLQELLKHNLQVKIIKIKYQIMLLIACKIFLFQFEIFVFIFVMMASLYLWGFGFLCGADNVYLFVSYIDILCLYTCGNSIGKSFFFPFSRFVWYKIKHKHTNTPTHVYTIKLSETLLMRTRSKAFSFCMWLCAEMTDAFSFFSILF